VAASRSIGAGIGGMVLENLLAAELPQCVALKIELLVLR
jgi:hypothetical protein